MDLLDIILIFSTGFAAGIINISAGGGSSLTMPLLIFLGLDASTANGTNRIAIFIQNIFASLSFKHDKISNFTLSTKMAVFTLPGAIIGAFAAVKIPDEIFEKILGVVIIFVVVSLFIPKKQKEIFKEYKNKLPWFTYLLMFGIGFYGGFVQAGVGFLIMGVLHGILGMNLVKVNTHKIFIVLLYTVPAILVFVITDNINYLYGFLLAAGNSSGGFLAAKLSVKKGEKFIKLVLVIAVLIISLKLFGLF